MRESFCNLGPESLFIRHSEIEPGRTSLLFVHGLGETGACFTEAFTHVGLRGFNLVAPDNVGYGRSSAAITGDYSFDAQIGRLSRLIEAWRLRNVVLVGHSLGGILVGLCGADDGARYVRGVVNIEGQLTASDAPFSRAAAHAFTDLCGGDFSRWREEFFRPFVERTPNPPRDSLKRYQAALALARPEAFLANAREICDRTPQAAGSSASPLGQKFLSISRVPTFYCWGDASLSPASVALLETSRQPHRGFNGSGHWVMIDGAPEFYEVLSQKLAEWRV